ncbi:amidohydrolase family protein [Falsiroseomonas oryzae]|uniref:amidohydrolase family protein n=1 Tax=Falsiroseomonas oryzae TaxID=2766473 RepID=UPI0022EA98B4|nr:amidohydrolase family protein [Roseomonas sp. MO-31]
MHEDLSTPPAFRAPPLSCDAHFHVFGREERYPYASAEPLRYKPPVAELADYLKLAAHLGLERFVFVQPSAYGRDNACMLDAMREVGPARCRGIVDVEEDAPDALLAEMHALGVRGVRINHSPVKPAQPGFSVTMLPRIRRLEARCVELGWHLDFLGPGWLTEELLPTLATLRCPFSVAHMGMFRAEAGPRQPGFVKLLDLVRGGTVQGYVKFTGTYRMATPPAYADALPMARAVIEAAPHNIIWGSDYPHLSFAHLVGSVQLFNLLADWAPDEAMRRRILVDNPAALFGF